MKLRLVRPRPGIRRVGSVLTRVTAAAFIAAAPLALSIPSAAAQAPPTAPAAPAAISPEVIATAGQSVGAVIYRKRATIGWVAGDGVVITSDIVADEVGKSVSFLRPSDSEPRSCYVARQVANLHLAVVRCDGLKGAALQLSRAYPTPGTAVFTLTVSANLVEDQTIVTHTEGVVLPNPVAFMKATRPQFTTEVTTLTGFDTGGVRSDFGAGAPIVGADGKVLSTILAAADAGGPPIGTVPKELAKVVADAKDLPATFSAAAVLAVARRALIPVAVGLVLGIIWSVAARDGNALSKTVGLAALGLVGAVAYTLFTVLVVGPQTLIG